MDISAILNGRHATASQCGSLLAASIDNKIRVHFAYAPERFLELSCGIPTKDLTSLKWSPNSVLLAAVSPAKIEVLDLNDPSFRCKLDNGSGGLGKFSVAEFLDNNYLVTSWEFGKLRVWDLQHGQALDLPDIKTTCRGAAWAIRPVLDKSGNAQTVAVLSKLGADDFLTISFPKAGRSMQSIRLAATDAQTLTWSPGGHWIAVLDAPTSNTSLHVLTPDGHAFRTWPTSVSDSFGLGIKSMKWSDDSCLLALASFDGKITLLNTKTFAPVSVIEHTTTINQHALAPPQQAIIWRETVSAAYDRSYTLDSQPISPSLSQTKPSILPSDLGIAECTFSTSGAFLATRDERMSSTIWLWNMQTFSLTAVILQHNNIRRMHWHPSHKETLLMEGNDGVCYLYDLATSRDSPPRAMSISLGITSQTWLYTPADARPVILTQLKTGFRLVYPAGRPTDVEIAQRIDMQHDEHFDEGQTDDSIFDVLSGRKEMPAKTEMSYTERVDLETAMADEDLTERLDDTFRDKQILPEKPKLEVDPLDDSQIF